MMQNVDDMPSSKDDPHYPPIQNIEWRCNEDENERNASSDRKVSLSRGVSPNRFYAGVHGGGGSSSNRAETSNHTEGQRRRPRMAAVLYNSIQEHYVKYQKSRVCQELEVKRSAFRQVTCLKTYPLQEMAVAHYQALLKDHVAGESSSSNRAILKDSVVKDDSSVSSAYEASSSGLSLDADVERKRTLRDAMLSPTKSRLKASYRKEFLAQQSMNKVQLERKSQLGPALWSMEPRVFSVEKSRTGKRKYITSHFGRFADFYWRKQDPSSRNFYEVILENTPCRLYLDLEFAKTDDKCRTERAEDILDELFLELKKEMRTAFPQVGALLRRHVVDLDSSTPTKFSRHWIVHTDPYLFAHTAAAGQFVTNWIGRLANEHATLQLQANSRNALQSHLFDEQQNCFVDMGVYTRNRLFRLMGSFKFGKNPNEATLRIADRNEFPLALTNEMFLPSRAPAAKLAVGSHDNKSKDEPNVDDKVEHFVQATDWTAHAQALSETLVIPLNATKLDYVILPYRDDAVLTPGDGSSESSATRQLSQLHTAGRWSQNLRGPSPYPTLDEYVVNILCRRGCQEGSAVSGSIRAWSLERRGGVGGLTVGTEPTSSRPHVITYFLTGNRWCERIQRAHKSNGVYWMIDLRQFTCTQGCFDPDCRSFRGTPIALPDAVRDALTEALFEDALAALNLDSPAEASASLSEPTLQSSAPTADEESLSDEALLNAVLSNPELFP